MWTPADPRDPLQRLIFHSRPWPVRVARYLGRCVLRLAVASALIWTITLPLVMYWFHLIAPAALVLNVFLWIPIALALFATEIGFLGLIGLVLLAFLAAVTAIGLAGLVACVGQRIADLRNHDMSPLARLVWGTLTVGFAALLPFIGWFVLTPILLMVAFGAAVLGWRNRKEETDF